MYFLPDLGIGLSCERTLQTQAMLCKDKEIVFASFSCKRKFDAGCWERL